MTATAGQGVCRLLLVEGGPATALLARQLTRCGYVVEFTRSAREALSLAQTGRWDAVVVDTGMPALTGVEFYTRLRRGCGRECLPMIFATPCNRQGMLGALRRVTRDAMKAPPLGVCGFLATLEARLLTRASVNSAMRL